MLQVYCRSCQGLLVSVEILTRNVFSHLGVYPIECTVIGIQTLKGNQPDETVVYSRQHFSVLKVRIR